MSGAERVSPVTDLPGDETQRVEEHIAVSLSGGGYRAMLFHTGALWRLLELELLSPRTHTVTLPDGRQAVLGTFKRISSVSGGSIISAMLGLKWQTLRFGTANLVDSYVAEVVLPIRHLAGVTLASDSLEGIVTVLGTILGPGSVNEHIAQAYDQHLYRKARLSELPADPRWVINASNLQSGALWRFMSPYMRDWRVGENTHTDAVTIAQAVAASSAFPPMLAPARFAFAESDFTPASGASGSDNLQRPPFTTDVVLADGGVYDNLGLETVYKRYRTLLVSDAGAPFAFHETVPSNWAGLGKRVIDVVDNQVRALRKRLLLDALMRQERRGAFWSIDADLAAFPAPDTLPCPAAKTRKLAAIDTDLGEKSARTQERLINWGYAACDAALRSYVSRAWPAPRDFPYPSTGVG